MGSISEFEPRSVQLQRPLCHASDTAYKDRRIYTWMDIQTGSWYSGPCSLTCQGCSCSGWGLCMGSCWRSRRGRRSPGYTEAPGARLSGRAQSPASRSCHQHLRAGRGQHQCLTSLLPHKHPSACPPLCPELQHEITRKWKTIGVVPAWSRAQRWKWWRGCPTLPSLPQAWRGLAHDRILGLSCG
jgi:hypothetical protein